MAEDTSTVARPARTAAEIRQELAGTRQRVTANVDAVEDRLRDQVSRLVQPLEDRDSGEPDFLEGLIRVLTVIRDVEPVRRWVGTPAAIAGVAVGFAAVTLQSNRHR